MSVEEQFHECISATIDELTTLNNALVDMFCSSLSQQHANQYRESQMSRFGNINAGDMLSSRIAESRAERDMWSLLDILSKSGAMQDINQENNDRSLSSCTNAMSLNSSLKDITNLLLANDERIRKTAIILEWLERAAEDKVTECPVTHGFAWQCTQDVIAHSSGKSDIRSLHPDAQLTADGYVKNLEGTDAIDQEQLLRTVWQLIRSGHTLRAQEFANEHGVSWLAASLLGVADEFDELVPTDSEKMEEGGPSEITHSMSKCKDNWSQGQLSHSRFSSSSSVASLECSIYAALSNNIPVLSTMPTINTWADRLWIIVKAVQECEILKIHHMYKLKRRSYSKYFMGCQNSVLNAEAKYLERMQSLIGHINCSDQIHVLFEMSGLPSCSISENGRRKNVFSNSPEDLIYQLQACLMEGKSGLQRYIQQFMHPIVSHYCDGLALSNGGDGASPICRLLRVFCHLCIWLKYYNDGVLADLVADDLYFKSLQAYCHQLMSQKQFSLVSFYCSLLPESSRLSIYVQLLHLLSGLSQEIGAEDMYLKRNVIYQAERHLSGDLLTIIRIVLHDTRRRLGGPVSNTTVTPTLQTEYGEVGTPSKTSAVDVAGPSQPQGSGRYKRRVVPRGSRAALGLQTARQEEDHQKVARWSAGHVSVSDVTHTHSHSDRAGQDQFDADVIRMKVLEWIALVQEDVFCLEAIKQVNMFASQFILESRGGKGNQIQYLCEHYPLKHLSKPVIEASRLALTVQLDKLHVSGDENGKNADVNAAVSRHLSMDWGAAVAKLNVWNSFVKALQAVDDWSIALSDAAKACRASSGGDQVINQALTNHAATIVSKATIASNCLLKTLMPDNADDGGVSSDPAWFLEGCEWRDMLGELSFGIKGIYLCGEMVTVHDLLCAIDTVANIVGSLYGGVEEGGDESVQPADMQSPEASNSLADTTPFFALLDEIIPLATDMFSNASEVSQNDSVVTNDGSLSQRLLLLSSPLSPSQNSSILNILSSLQSIKKLLMNGNAKRMPSTASAEGSASIHRLLSDCLDLLTMLAEQREVVAHIAFKCMENYVTVCMETGRVLQLLNRKDDALEWCSSTMQFSNVIADEDQSLQLYSLISGCQLQGLLTTLSTAAGQMMELQPTFSL